MKPLVFAIALALSAPLPVLVQAATPAVQAKPAPAWVEASNRNAQILLKAQAAFQPEYASFFGVPGYDEKVADLGPDNARRYREATAKARDELKAKLQVERDSNVRQDLEIMIKAADEAMEGSALNERYLLPWSDAPQSVFSGLNGLLSDQTSPERRAKALDRLKAYAGLAPGSTALTTLARQRYEEKLTDGKLLQPSKLEVERAVGNGDTYVTGVREMFAKYKIAGAEEALDAMEKQFKDYNDWTRSTVLPKARTDTRLPPELYAFQLKQYGIDIDPALLMQRAQLEFMETRAAMQALAPLVAKAKGIDANDYREVIKALKKKSIANDQLETYYRGIIDQIDPIIAAEKIVDVPNRPMQMRLGSAAESAAQPAPHFLPAPLVGN
ncbi:MAG: DUF885 family protein, partial [Pseudoxanthomonas sp.]